MNALADYMQREGRSADEVAVDLSALLGKKIGAGGVRLHASRAKTPQAWADALGLPPDPIREEADASSFEQGTTEDSTPLFRDDGTPPTPPPGADVKRPASSGGAISLTAKKRIEMAYTAIGAGASLVTNNKGYEAVADNYAPSLADAWMAAAEQNKTIAKIVAFMESGGPVGELVVGHIILVLGFAYVSGRGPNLEIIYGRFAGYRAAALAAEVQRQAEEHVNGSGHAAPEGFVGEPAV